MTPPHVTEIGTAQINALSALSGSTPLRFFVEQTNIKGEHEGTLAVKHSGDATTTFLVGPTGRVWELVFGSPPREVTEELGLGRPAHAPGPLGLELVVIDTPGHSWLKVPMALLSASGYKPTEYSTMFYDHAFLEEDVDMVGFLDAIGFDWRHRLREIPVEYDSSFDPPGQRFYLSWDISHWEPKG